MILMAGGTGTLGAKVVPLLRAQGLPVRVLTRDRARADRLGADVEVVEGDARSGAGLDRAVAGAQTVISAIQGFAGARGDSPASVDRDGNRNLIRAARDAGAGHMVLVSVKDAAPDHPMSLMRMKHAAEEELRRSGLEWTIVRPTAFMETWCEVLGRPLLDKGKTMVFGKGLNPVNWVSADDVAAFVALAATDRGMRGQIVEVGGPDNLSMSEFVRVFQDHAKTGGKVGHVPRAAMRLAAVVARLASPAAARKVQAGVVMDTRPQAFDAAPARQRYPQVPVTSLAHVVRRDFAGEAQAATA